MVYLSCSWNCTSKWEHTVSYMVGPSINPDRPVRDPKWILMGFKWGVVYIWCDIDGKELWTHLFVFGGDILFSPIVFVFLAEFQYEQNHLLWRIYLYIRIYIYLISGHFRNPNWRYLPYIRPSWRPMFAGISQQNIAKKMVRLRTSILGSGRSPINIMGLVGWLVNWQLATLYVSQAFRSRYHMAKTVPKYVSKIGTSLNPFISSGMSCTKNERKSWTATNYRLKIILHILENVMFCRFIWSIHQSGI
jgi:hypothetical protein